MSKKNKNKARASYCRTVQWLYQTMCTFLIILSVLFMHSQKVLTVHLNGYKLVDISTNSNPHAYIKRVCYYPNFIHMFVQCFCCFVSHFPWNTVPNLSSSLVSDKSSYLCSFFLTTLTIFHYITVKLPCTNAV